MIAKIINTVSSKIGLAIIAILLLLLNSNFLGSEGLGAIGIIVLEISVYLLVVNLIAGGSLIYYASRYKISNLLVSSYLWVLITALLFYAISRSVPSIQIQYLEHIILLGMLQALVGIHSNLLVGKEKIKTFNAITLLQAGVQIVVLLIFFFALNERNVEAFIYSTYVAYGVATVYSFYRLYPHLESRPSILSTKQLKSLFHYGFFIQIANISQLLNYRLSYFFLQYFSGLAAVGRFMPAVQISEGILLPAKSIGIVQYAKISNLKNHRRSAWLTLLLVKLVGLISLPIVLICMLLPQSFFTLLFGDDFGETSIILSLMSMGILALSMEVILSRYFSGTGNQKINASSSILGLVITCGAGLAFIPEYGLYGAAITSSLSYSCMLGFLLYHFTKKTDRSLVDFGWSMYDLKFIRRLLSLILKRRIK